MTDPKQLFVVSALSRSFIAEQLNNYLAANNMPRLLSEDDDRLTDEVCKKYAEEYLTDPDLNEEERADAHSDLCRDTLISMSIFKQWLTTVRGVVNAFLASNKIARDLHPFDFMADFVQSLIDDEKLTLDDFKGYLDSLYEGDNDT